MERPVGDEGVVVIGGADDDGVEVLLIKALSPIGGGDGAGETTGYFDFVRVYQLGKGND